MATTIKLKNSVTTTAAPTTLVQGEAAVNVTDKKVWVGNAASSPVQILGAGATVSGTDATFTGVTTVQAGTVSAPAITTTGDTNTGIFFPAADTIAFTEGGVESMRITSAGNVGIGISTPATNLHINETDVSGTDVDIVRFSTASGGVINFVCSDLSSSIPTWTLQTGTSEPLAFKQGTTERMRIDSSGNVLINTSATRTEFNSRLLIEGTTSNATGSIAVINNNASAASGYIALGKTRGAIGSNTTVVSGDNLGSLAFYGADGTGLIYSAGITATSEGTIATGQIPSRMSFSTASSAGTVTERMRLDSSGNLGLSVTPSAWTSFRALEISGGAVAGISQNQLVVTQNAYYDSNFKYKTTGAATVYQQAGAQHAWLTAASGTAGNAITFTQAMTLDASGRLGIGTTSPASKLDISGTFNATSFGVIGARTQIKGTNADITGATGSGTEIFGGSTPGILAYNRDGSAFLPITINALTVALQAQSTTRGLFSSSGLAVTGTIGGTTTIGVGAATPAASGAGITFPATQSASSDANTLDDYEEGTFSPTIASGFSTAPTSYSTQRGAYTKIGRYVYFQIQIDANGAVANSTGLQIGGLPFTCADANSVAHGGAFFNYQNSFDTNAGDTFHIINASTTIGIYANAGTPRLGNSAGVNINNEFLLCGFYMTA